MPARSGAGWMRSWAPAGRVDASVTRKLAARNAAVLSRGEQMLSTKALGVYLNDHLAGSVAGVDLLDQSRDHNKGTPLGAFLDALLEEIRADQQALEALMDQLGIEKS